MKLKLPLRGELLRRGKGCQVDQRGTDEEAEVVEVFLKGNKKVFFNCPVM